RDFADVQVPPADFAAVRLEQDRPGPGQRGRPVLGPVSVLQPCVVYDELAVQVDGGPLADLNDAEAVPFAERLVGQHERVLARSVLAVIPQAAAALIGPEVELLLLGRLPDVHLRASS